MRLASHFVPALTLFVTLAACEGPTTPVPPPPPPCAYTLSVTSLSFPASGGSASVGITATSGCSWAATTDREWISITNGATGTGSGTVTVTAGVNPGTSIRTGTLTVAGHAVAVQQAAQPQCSLTLAPTAALHSHNPATGTFAITTPSYCSWAATSTAGWLTITSAAQGTGNGTVTYAIDRNREVAPRTAAIVVNGQNFSVLQEAESVSCNYAVTPVEFAPCMAFTNDMTAAITTQATCSWTAVPNASWITVTEGQSGIGSGIIRFRVSENWDPPRLGIVEVRWPTVTAGQNLRITQAGCYYAVSPAAIAVGASGGNAQFDVLQQSDPIGCGGPLQDACLWTAVSHAPWISITTGMPQHGDNPVRFSVAPNTTGAARSGTIEVRDKVVTITQSGS